MLEYTSAEPVERESIVRWAEVENDETSEASWMRAKGEK
jgi:hypothetical protein